MEEEVRYVPSKLNPADSLTKPVSVEALKAWHQGPKFLRQPESHWPKFEEVELEPDCETLEKPKPKTRKYRGTKKVLCLQAGEEKDFGGRLAENASSWVELLKIVMWMKFSLERKTFSHIGTNVDDMAARLNYAKQTLFKLCQKPLHQDLQKTRQRYFKFDITIDAFGCLFCSN